ncbi:carbohydrate ABC transporter permease [Streptomyces turgidiscabies]|uniref:ABC transporter, permease protein n=1 Tax=Streptomyces turgidiscabies (strain Car8) TaxID=698760 RepID=L7FGF0_STRT8|nr:MULTISPECIES: carbohydrate ABC transporter permease [Streptomyces]ELP70264.1 ABC transporter, permease protein [Streptomyces turgidiscabies Car8]MDX3496065.1 carbohydrate ABC transporter permease [Streptomyces turgidiscabies]GAQ72445.1 lactose transport system permease protein LacG [Streptomyces turgidiscabies]
MTTSDLTLPQADTEPKPKEDKGSGRRRIIGAGKQLHAGPVTYVVLVVLSLVSLAPLLWTAIAASRDNTRLAQTPPPLWFGSNLFKNMQIAWDEVGLGTAMLNSTLVAGTITVSTVLFSTLAGFAFAKLRFRFSGALLLLTIGTMMIPPQLAVVPLYLWMADLGWSNQLQAVILPTLVTAFGTFFMRQYLVQALPSELIEAARVDGANSLRVVWHVVFPAARPAMAVLGLLTFVFAWNDFLWPIIALNQQNPTVQVALNALGTGYVPDQAVIMAGALLGTLPLLIAFLLFGKQIVGGIMNGAIKG